MIKVGKYNNLEIIRDESIGLFLGDNEGEEILLPNKQCPIDYKVGDKLRVFVFIDRNDRKVATNKEPKITLYTFAKLRVESVTDKGAFMEWGMDKHLYVPLSEQRIPMELGEWHFVFMMQDERTEKLYGTKKVEKYLQNEDLTVKEGEEVDLLIYQNAGIGLSVIINDQHKGMIHNNQLFKNIHTGERVKGYIQRIRDDNKIDVSLQPIGYRNFNDPNCEIVIKALEKNDGFLNLNDKSKPEDIYDKLGMSKKSFKKSVGSLYKEKKIEIKDNGIKLNE